MLYAHTHTNNFGGPKTTFTLIPPTRSQLEECFKMHANQMMMLIGLSVASPHDNFDRSVGRSMAEQRTVPRVAELLSVDIHGTKHVYHLISKIQIGHKEYLVDFKLTTIAETEEVKLIKVMVR